MPEELDLKAGSNPEVHSDQDQGPTSETDDAAPSPPNSLPRRFREPHRDYHPFGTQPWSARSPLNVRRVPSFFFEYNLCLPNSGASYDEVRQGRKACTPMLELRQKKCFSCIQRSIGKHAVRLV